MFKTLCLRFTVDQDCPVDELLADGSFYEYFPLSDGTTQLIAKNIPYDLLDGMDADALGSFCGIDSEFLIAAEVLNEVEA